MATRIVTDAEPIPGYRLIERLGRGGFGEVWKALAPGGIHKAIKFVYGDLDEATDGGKPAQQELKALNRVKSIRHPYILSLERYDIIDGQLLIVMELADRNLFDQFRECQNQGLVGIPRDELLSYMEETAEALDLMNSQFQLQHLDIKPQNLFLVFNHVKVADFGLAKDLEGMQATLTGGVTPVYAAPETFECRVTRFCDQYSLAIVYQELLTGQRPFNGSTARHLMMQHIQSPPDLSSLPEHDRPFVLRALAKKPDERFPTCAALVQSLKNAEQFSAQPVIVEVEKASELPAIEPKVLAKSVTTRTPVPQRDRTSLSPVSPRAGATATNGRNGASLPSLVTARGLAGSAALANARPAPQERLGDGVLFPALVIGLGQYGLNVLQRLRRTLRDRYGNSPLPHMRMLYIDTEGETLQSTNSAGASVDNSEVYLARLNRPSHYNRSREDLPDVGAWLNPQLLFRIPRQPTTNGVRAFGRLAFCDHYRAITAKIRSELEAAVADQSLAEAAAKTRLELRTNQPRVYIISSLMGGSGGGMFLDLAYAVRLQMKLLGYKHPEVHGLLFAPQIDEITPKSQAVANSFAALTELLHYSSPSTTYDTTFDRSQGAIVDRDPPFRRCMLLPLPTSQQSAEMRPMVGLGTSFLFHEMFTLIGRNADRARNQTAKPAPAGSLQTYGAFRLTWPRRVLIERSGRRVCERLLASWTAKGGDQLVEPVRIWLEEQWSTKQLGPELVRQRVWQNCARPESGDWAASIQAVVNRFEAVCANQGLETADMVAAMEQAGAVVGTPDLEGRATNGGELGTALDQIIRAMSSEAEQLVVEMSRELVELPGSRLLGAEEFLRQLSLKAQGELTVFDQRGNRLAQEVHDLYIKYVTLCQNIETMSRGNRRASASRDALVLLHDFARKRLEHLECKTTGQFYRAIISAVPDRQRDMMSCRKRLDSILYRLKDRRASSDRHGYFGPDRALVPPGCASLDDAAGQIADSLGAEQLLEIDSAFQERLVQTSKGLSSCCLDKSEPSRQLFESLFDQAQEYLASYLINSNAAAIFFQRQLEQETLEAEIINAFEQAAPTVAGQSAKSPDEVCLLAVPKEEDGERFSELARGVLADSTLETLPGFDDIIFCRERQQLDPSEIPQLGPSAQEAFNHVTNADQAAPHTRIDVRWQSPRRDEA